MKGRKPKPTAQKLLEGNLGQRRLNESEPLPVAIVKQELAPKELSPEGQVMYLLLTDICIRMKTMTEAERMIVHRYSDTWARWKRASEFLRDNGEKYRTYARVTEYDMIDGKKVKKHKLVPTGWATYPEVSVYQSCAAMLTKYEQELGLTPAARTRISTAASEVLRGAKTIEEVSNDNPFQYN